MQGGRRGASNLLSPKPTTRVRPPSNRPKRDAGISVRIRGRMRDFGGVYPETHHVEDRLLPLKQTVRHPLDPMFLLRLRARELGGK
jgi:hypothetical protein